MGLVIPLVIYRLLHCFVSVTSDDGGHYIMLVPSVIYENSLVTVAVSTMNYGNDEHFQVKLSGDGGRKEIKRVKSSQTSDTVLLQFKTQTLENGPYQLHASSPGGKEHKIDIKVMKRPVVILVQTDKPIYKPGDTIKFRVLVLDHETRPLKNLKSVKVLLRDSEGNLIREWPFATLQQGVFQSQIDLANFIPLGEWTLTVYALKNEEKKKSITIAEYVLPTHEIHIKSPTRTTFKDKSLELTIDARYTFGKPIKGVLSVTFGETDYSYESIINGRSVISVAIKDVIDLNYQDEIFWLNVNVKVNESESSHIYEASENIPIYKRSHKLELRKSSEYLLSEEFFRCWLTLTDPDGIPLENPGAVQVNVTRFVRFWFNKHYSYNTIPDTNGDVGLMLDSSASTKKLELEVEYDGEVTKFQIHRETDFDEEDKPFFQTVLLEARPKLNQAVEVLVQSSFHMNLVLYHVISQGEIMSSGRVIVENKRSVTFAFKTNTAMIPEASLAVLAINEGRLWTNVVRFKIHDLSNNVDVKLSTNSSEPGGSIDIIVTSQPGSMIGLLAIDRGMLQLGSGNDITKQLVLEELGVPRAADGDEVESLGFTVITNAQKKVKLSAFQPVSRFGEDDGMLFEISNDPKVNVLRKKFPETWLWVAMAIVDANGRLEIEENLPDSITGWSISAFSINKDSGLGVVDFPLSLNVLKSFFITVNLAYSIVKTETAVVEVFVHNYLAENQEAAVQILNHQGDFLFVDQKNETSAHLAQSQRVIVPSNSVNKVTFMLKPTRSGNLIITVVAECADAKDAVQHKLRVTPGGLLYFQNEARYIEVEQSSMSFTNLQLVIPKTVTSGSENIVFSAEGILLGAALANLDQLIRLPSGCGEQNMLNLVPSVIALEYMSNTATLRETIKAKAIGYLQTGYQNQLRFKLSDGSFSVFGQSDGRGSVFLTALTARTFRFAEKYIDVDGDVIKKAFNWLGDQQQSDGRFIETGKIYYKALQSGLKDGTTLTAYILIALLEHKTLALKYKSVVEKGVNYISDQGNSLKTPYDISLVTYALHLANHPRKDHFFEKLVELSQTDGNWRWWGNAPTNIETTAYALLTYMTRGIYVDAKPIMKWLVSQRYDKGGYDSTQNTYVGLQALGQYSQKMSISRNDYQITVAFTGGQHQLHMDRESSLAGLQLTLPSNVRSVDVTANGTGVGAFQIAYRYNVLAKDTEPRFTIENTIENQGKFLTMNICTSFKPKRPFEETNMVMMEVSLPSGYAVAHRAMDRLKRNEKVQKIETKEGESHLILYLDPLLANDPVCVGFKAVKAATVLNQVAGWIKVYDYYDPTREALEYFDMRKRK